MARPVLAELAMVTGLDAVYVTRINWHDHEQEILASTNLAPEILYIPEEVKIDYSDAVCRYVIEGGPSHTDDVPVAFPESDMARFLRFQSFVSFPLELPDGEIFGTLCGASTRRVKLTSRQLAEFVRRARLITGWLDRDHVLAAEKSLIR
jgi:diguanylate cyclase